MRLEHFLESQELVLAEYHDWDPAQQNLGALRIVQLILDQIVVLFNQHTSTHQVKKVLHLVGFLEKIASLLDLNLIEVGGHLVYFLISASACKLIPQVLEFFVQLRLNSGLQNGFEFLASQHCALSFLGSHYGGQSKLSVDDAQFSEHGARRDVGHNPVVERAVFLIEEKRIFFLESSESLVGADGTLPLLVFDQHKDSSLEDDVEVLGDGSLLEDYSRGRKQFIGEVLDQLHELLPKVLFYEFLKKAQIFELLHQEVKLLEVPLKRALSQNLNRFYPLLGMHALHFILSC